LFLPFCMGVFNVDTKHLALDDAHLVATALDPEALRRERDTLERAYAALAALEVIEGLLESDAGYVRIGKDAAGKFYVRWKWTAGSLGGRYCFAAHRALCTTVEALGQFVDEVRAGKRYPARDNPSWNK